MSEAHLQLLLRLVDLLERYATEVTPLQIGSDLEIWLTVRGGLETAAQCCIDLALAMVAKRRLGPAESYRHAFSLLGQSGALPAELASQLATWAGLRNVLAHVYTTLDLDMLHAALCNTAPLRAFAEIAAREFGSAAQ
ncbi:MAG: DUF86 domain-containing protein [Deltaproteobacteria bacterium]|nr:DUF86 domain-containing protein [Deltaproteobacteria bacterium]